MKVKAIETGTEYELTAIDAASGTEWTRDLLGNAGAQFERNDDDEIVAPLVEIEWWLPVIADLNAADTMREEAKARGLMTEAVERELQSIDENDLDTQASATRQFYEQLLADGE